MCIILHNMLIIAYLIHSNACDVRVRILKDSRIFQDVKFVKSILSVSSVGCHSAAERARVKLF